MIQTEFICLSRRSEILEAQAHAFLVGGDTITNKTLQLKVGILNRMTESG